MSGTMSNLSTFEFHFPADLEREHWDHVDNARYDYYSEAYGAEARALDEQARWEAIDDAREAEATEAAERGISVEALRAEYAERAKREAEVAQCEACRERIASFFIPF